MCFFFDTCSGLLVSKSEFQQFKMHSKQLIPSVSANVQPGVVQHSKFRAPIPTSGKYFLFLFQHDILPSYGQLCSRYDTVQDDLAGICDGMAAICVCTDKRVLNFRVAQWAHGHDGLQSWTWTWLSSTLHPNPTCVCVCQCVNVCVGVCVCVWS